MSKQQHFGPVAKKIYDMSTTCRMSRVVSASFLVSRNATCTTKVTASQPLVTTRAKVTMPNTMTDLDQEHDHNQGPVPMILEAQHTIMVSIFMMMTTGKGNGCAHQLLSLV